MIIYIAIFSVSCFCLYAKEHTKGFLSKFLMLVGISLPCILAAVRDKSIGTDVTVYGVSVYRDTKGVGLLEAINLRSENPPGFVALAWIINLVDGSFQLYLFIIELLVILPAYLAISYFLKKDAWLGMLLFYFLFYAISLNLMKQMIAVSFTAYALCLALEKHYKSWILCSVITVLIHQTGIVSFLIYPLYLIFAKTSSYALLKKIFIYLSSFVFIAAIFTFSDYFLTALSTLKDSYSYMIANRENGGFLLFPIIYLVFVVFLHIVDSVVDGGKQNLYPQIDKNNIFLIEYLCIIGLLLMELQVITLGLGRFGYYFEFYLSVLVVYRFIEKNIFIKFFSFIFIIIIVCIQIKFVLDGNCEVYPYSSSILGIG